MAKRMTTRAAMDIIARKMDDREEFKTMIREFVVKHGYAPKQYEAEWERMKDEKPWRQDAACMAKLRKAARRMAQNERNKKLNVRSTITASAVK